MKILTWNVGRPERNPGRIPSIQKCLIHECADLVILTETSLRINLVEGYGEPIHTDSLVGQRQCDYREGDRRVSLYSRYPVSKHHQVYDSKTVLCSEVVTPNGPLLVYGTIIGLLGNRRECFYEHLDRQLDDIVDLSKLGLPLCVAGDLNQSFADNYYFTPAGREALLNCFLDLGLQNLTAAIPRNIDHIVLASKFLAGRQVKVSSWNHDKDLSDHIGVGVEIEA